MAVTPPDTSGSSDAQGGIGDLVHLALVVILSFAPATVAQLFPEGVLDEKETAFIYVYLVTFPLAAAATLVVIGFANEWFGAGEGYLPLLWIGAIVFGVSIIATGTVPSEPGATEFEAVTSYADAAGKVAHPLGKIVAVIGYAIFAYALIYGLPLFIAGVIVGCYAGYRLDRWLFASKREAANAAPY